MVLYDIVTHTQSHTHTHTHTIYIYIYIYMCKYILYIIYIIYILCLILSSILFYPKRPGEWNKKIDFKFLKGLLSLSISNRHSAHCTHIASTMLRIQWLLQRKRHGLGTLHLNILAHLAARELETYCSTLEVLSCNVFLTNSI